VCAPQTDPDREVTYYTRSKVQDRALCIYEEGEVPGGEIEPEKEKGGKQHEEREAAAGTAAATDDPDALTTERLAEEVLHFSTNCPDCNAPATTNMKVTSK
jgi:hypothetical protein